MGGRWLEQIFLEILHMSLIGTCCIPFVFFIRFLLKRCPKVFSYLLWFVVFFRLACPFSFESPVGLFQMPESGFMDSLVSQSQKKTEIWGKNQNEQNRNNENTLFNVLSPNGVKEKDDTLSSYAFPKEERKEQKNFLEKALPFAAGVWIFGFCGMLIYILGSMGCLKKRFKTGVPKDCSNRSYYEVKDLDTPLVFGLIYPKVY